VADVWNYRNAEHVRTMLALLAPLVAAARPREFADKDVARDQAKAFLMALKDVPADVLEEAIANTMVEGVKWMPKPGDLREACAAVVDGRRRVAARKAKALAEDCAQCGGSQWETVVIDGVERVQRCRCFALGLELMAGVEARLSLPPARSSEGEAA